MNTIEKYEIESEDERGGWRGAVGKLLAFLGFIVFANFTIVALLFRQLLSLRVELILAALGAVVGVAGLVLRGNSRRHIELAVITVMAGIIAAVLVNLTSRTFGMIGLVVVLLAFAWWETRFGGRVRD